MKNLTPEEFDKAPNIVQYVYIMSMSNIPIGSKIYEETIRDHPEYFYEEISETEKWNKIPQEVHDAYWKEYGELKKEVFKDVPPSKGLMAYIGGSKEYKEWEKLWNVAYKKWEPLKRKLHRKYYSKYGIEYCCN